MKIKHSARQLISYLLILCMIFTIAPQFVITPAYAADTGGNSMLQLLGFSTDSSQYQAEINSKENPFGQANFSVITRPELLVTSASYDGTWAQYSRVFGKDNDNFVTQHGNNDGGRNAYLLTGADTGKPVNEYVGGCSHIKDVAFDPTGCGRANYIVREIGYSVGNTTEFWLRLINADTGAQAGTDLFLCTLPFSIEETQTRAFFSVVAGDFNGDGKDEMAVYIPYYYGIPQVITYTVNTAPAANQSSFSWYSGVDLVTEAGLSYYSDYASTSGGKYVSHITRWPIVDMAVLKNTSIDRTNDLVIAVSPARNLYQYGAPSWSDSTNLYTRVLLIRDPMNRYGNNQMRVSNKYHMKFEWSQYGVSGSLGTSKYEVMMYGGVTSADVNGDGYEDIVIAGYRNYNNVSGNTSADLDNRNYLVTYCPYKPEANAYIYNDSSILRWVDASKLSNYYQVTDYLTNGNNNLSNVMSPLAVAGFAERGDGYADSIFVNGVVARLGAGGKNSYAPDKNLEPYQFNADIKTIYKVPLEKIRGDKTKRKWIIDPVAGNFDGNALGMEQLMFLYGLQTSSSDSTVAGFYDVICVEQTVAGDPEVKINPNASGWNQEVVSGHLFSYREKQTADTGFSCATLAIPDVDSDSIIMQFTGQRDFYFSDPHVMGILQASPYFADLAIEDSFYASTGSTSLAYNKGSGSSQTNDFKASAGVMVGMDADILGFVKFEFEVKVTASLGGGFATESSTTYSTAFTSASGDDGVVLVMTPYVRYYFNTWTPAYTVMSQTEYNYYVLTRDALTAKYANAYADNVAAYINGDGTYNFSYGGKNWGGTYSADQASYKDAVQQIAAADSAINKGYGFGQKVPGRWEPTSVSYPKEPRLTITTVTNYDEIAMQSGTFAPIRKANGGSILANTPGDPRSYGDTQPNGWMGGKAVASKSPSTYLGLPIGSYNTISQGIDISTSSSKTITWGLELELSCSQTISGVKAGYSLGAEYSGGKTWTSMDGQTYTGTVAGVPADLQAYYNFMWQFGSWTASLNGEPCIVLGYLVKDVTNTPSAPHDVHISNIAARSLELKWSPGPIPGASYQVYRLSDVGTWFLLGNITDGSLTYLDSQCVPSTAYTYVVRAVTASNIASVNSAQITGHTNPEGNVPVITQQPKNIVVSPAGNAVFTVAVQSAAGNVGALTYQWQVYDGTAWKNVQTSMGTGITTNTLTVTSPQKSMNGYRFRCFITQMVDSVIKSIYSNSALITTVPANAAPDITGTTGMSLTVGYTATSTSEYTITGYPIATVAQNTSHGGKITWNNSTGKLEIAAGLAAGSYPVVLTASNGVSPDATITFTLIVAAEVTQSITAVSAPYGGSVTITLAKVRTATDTIIVAVYTQSGKLLAMQTNTGTAISATFNGLPTSDPGTGASQAFRIKAMLWTGVNTMEPLCPPVTLQFKSGLTPQWEEI